MRQEKIFSAGSGGSATRGSRRSRKSTVTLSREMVAPMRDAAVDRLPALDPCEQAFDARSIEENPVGRAKNRARDCLTCSGAIEDRDQVLGAGENERRPDSLSSLIAGQPLVGFTRDRRRPMLQPKPNGPFPDPESYEQPECGGENPERPGLSGSGMEIPLVPVAALTENFSPIPRGCRCLPWAG